MCFAGCDFSSFGHLRWRQIWVGICVSQPRFSLILQDRSIFSTYFATLLLQISSRASGSIWIFYVIYWICCEAEAFHNVNLNVNSCSYPYLAVVLNFSQTWALYCLVQFYSVTKIKLAPIKPLAKFLVFKSIVFLTWWQGIAVAFLLSFGTFKGSLAQLLKTRIQDYIICIEVSCVYWISFYSCHCLITISCANRGS